MTPERLAEIRAEHERPVDDYAAAFAVADGHRGELLAEVDRLRAACASGITLEELAQMTAELVISTPLKDTGHSQTCDCSECRAAWARGTAYQAYARRAVTREMPRLLAELLRIREAIAEAGELP